MMKDGLKTGFLVYLCWTTFQSEKHKKLMDDFRPQIRARCPFFSNEVYWIEVAQEFLDESCGEASWSFKQSQL